MLSAFLFPVLIFFLKLLKKDFWINGMIMTLNRNKYLFKQNGRGGPTLLKWGPSLLIIYYEVLGEA